MRQPIIECSGYDNKAQPSYHEMHAIAWMLRTDKAGKQIGFVSPKEYNELRRKGEER